MKNKPLRLIIALICAVASWQASNAAIITVTNTNPSGPGSLSAALLSSAAGDTIDFALSGCPCTITPGSGGLVINKNLIIKGPGASQLTISGNNAFPVITITDSGPASSVTISGLTIANGAPPQNWPGQGSPGAGGVIVNNGPLLGFNTIADCVLTNNTGGAIFVAKNNNLTVLNSTFTNNQSGAINTPSTGGTQETVTVIGCTFSNNTANILAGALYIGPTAQLTSSNCTYTNNSSSHAGAIQIDGAPATIRGGSIDSNHATSTGNGGGISSSGALELSNVAVTNNTIPASQDGGGIYCTGPLSIYQSNISGNQSGGGAGGIFSSDNLVIVDSTIAGNMATGTVSSHWGSGGIRADGPSTLTGCTISGNSAKGIAGGILFNNPSNPGTLTNCTISGNTVTAGSGGTAAGGGLAGGNNTTLNNCTIAFNSATTGGGVLGASAVTINNTLIAQNTATSGPDASSPFATLGHNLIGDNHGVTGVTNGSKGDIVGGSPVINPMLDPLADNGGLTKTHALQASSPAIDKGYPGFGVTTDQRGFPRCNDIASATNAIGSNFSDIGAFEADLPALLQAVSQKTHGTQAFAINLPLVGSPGIECRSGGPTSNHEMIFRFNHKLASVSGAIVTSGIGMVSSRAIGSDQHEYVVDLTGVADAQRVTLTLSDVTDSLGYNKGTVSASAGFLLGDTSGNGAVNATDVSQTKLKSGQAVDATNFRNDVTVSSSINATDVSTVKLRSGTALP